MADKGLRQRNQRKGTFIRATPVARERDPTAPRAPIHVPALSHQR